MYKVTILNDISLPYIEEPFPKTSVIYYDAKNPRRRKQHQILFQQGATYGSVGDRCKYLTHDQLLALEASGHVKINRVRRRQR